MAYRLISGNVEWNNLVTQFYKAESDMKKLDATREDAKRYIHASTTEFKELKFLLIAELVTARLCKQLPDQCKDIISVHPYVLRCDWARIRSLQKEIEEKLSELEDFEAQKESLQLTIDELAGNLSGMDLHRAI